MRAIDADELYYAISETSKDAGFYRAIYDGFLNIINRSPTIEAEPVRHGRWIERSDKGIVSITHPYVCNLCGRVEMVKEPYCNCGAKMRGDADE